MTLENRTMNSIHDLQFLNLDGASEKEKQEILNILYGETNASTVEFPWEFPSVGASKYAKNDDVVGVAEPVYGIPNYPPPSEGMPYQTTYSDAAYSLVCVPPVCSYPVHPPAMPMMPIQDTMMAASVLQPPLASDSELYVQAKHMPLAYPDHKGDSDHRGPHRSGKKKRREKYSYPEPVEYGSNMMLDDYTMPHGLQQTSHLAPVSVPVSLSATDPHGLSAQHHVSYMMAAAGYQALGPFYTGPSQMYYQNAQVYVYPPGMYPNYAGHPAAPNYTHMVSTEPPPPITPEPLSNATIDVEMLPSPPSNNTVCPALPVDTTTCKPIPKKVPNETFSQEKSAGPELPRNGTKNVVPDEPRRVCAVEDNVAAAEKNEDPRDAAERSSVVGDTSVCVAENDVGEEAIVETAFVSFVAPPAESEERSVTSKASEPAVTPPTDSKKTYASLFKRNDAPPNNVSRPCPVNHVEFTAPPNRADGLVSGSKDVVPAELKEILSTIQLDHHSVHFVPRGLSNKGNWCYINATLQALLACPPFHNLMRRLPTVIGLKKESSVVPVTEAVVEFVHEFSPLEHSKKTNRGNGKICTTESKGEMIFGEPFEPKYIFDMLRKNKREDFAKGRQEDAEEFLTWMLNQVHEEMVKIKSSDAKESNLKNGDVGMPNGDVAASNGDDNLDDDDEWQVIGHKNKSCATRSLHSNPSPIVDIFGGQICSVLQHAGCNKSQNLEPFFTLQLDIQADNVTCIKTALEGLSTKETLEGYTCSTTNQEIEASRRIMLEKLPRVLILHLKRFVYHDGGIKKLLKSINFDFDLELSKDLLSHAGRMEKNRSYKLFAVVYHDGQDAAKGHYVADVYHDAYRCWLRADDSKLKSIDDNLVLKYEPPRVPYLLYYRRDDTIV